MAWIFYSYHIDALQIRQLSIAKTVRKFLDDVIQHLHKCKCCITSFKNFENFKNLLPHNSHLMCLNYSLGMKKLQVENGSVSLFKL